MVEWVWIPIAFLAGGVFGIMLAALNAAARNHDDEDWR